MYLFLVLATAVCLLQVDFSSAVTPVILNGPVTQVVPFSQNEAQFTCHARASAVFWFIDDESLFGNTPDCVLRLYDDIHDFDNVEVTRRIGIRVQGCNGTKVECIGTGDSVPNAKSAPAYLYLVDAPSPPEPTLTILNETALQVSWTEPFSWSGFPILKNTLNIRNVTSSSIIDTIVFTDPDSSISYVFSIDSILNRCDNISMEVTANNSVGTSNPGLVTGGFPVALGDFLISPFVEVTFSTDLSPIINVTFKPPLVCWFQEARYELRLFDTSTREQVASTRDGSYRGGEIPTFSEPYDFGIEKEKNYEAIVVIDSLTGTTNATTQFNTSINISPQDIPQLTIVNSTAISVHWNRSSTFGPNVEISYTLVIRNESDQFDLEEQVFNTSADFTSYPLSYVYSIDGMDNSGCNNISFTIFSHSGSGGNERPGSAVTGFPVGPSNFSDSLLAEVSFTTTLQPKLEVVFEYPSICWYQSGTYKIQILNATGGEEVSMGPVQYRSTDNPHISKNFKAGLSRDRDYKAVVTVESFGESMLAEMNFRTGIEPQMTEPLPPTTGPFSTKPAGLSIETIAGLAAGCFLILILVLGVCIVCVLAHLRRRKKKVERLRRPPLPQVPNPLYETGGPIYEEIPAEKNFNKLVKQQLSTPSTPCSEYVTIEGKMNGGIDHYDQLCVSEKDFEDIKKPLDQLSMKSLGLTNCGFPEAPPFTAGEDPYTLMNPAGAASASKGQQNHCQSLSKSTGSSHAPIRPSLSLPQVPLRVSRQESDSGDTPEERYVRRSLLI